MLPDENICSSLSLPRMQIENHKLGKNPLNQLLLELLTDHQTSTYHDKILVTSRSVIDRYANSVAAGLFDTPLGAELEPYYKECRIPEQLKIYDFIIYVPIRFGVVDDGVRNTDEKNRCLIDEITYNTLQKYSKDYIVADQCSPKYTDQLVDEIVCKFRKKSFQDSKNNITVKYKLTDLDAKAPIMKYLEDKEGSTACFDLFATKDQILSPQSTTIIHCGIQFEVSPFVELLVRGRSGMARRGVTTHMGTVDSNYRGDCGPIIHNQTHGHIEVRKGERVCQVAVRRFPRVLLKEVKELSETSRGDKGFGSTGL